MVMVALWPLPHESQARVVLRTPEAINSLKVAQMAHVPACLAITITGVRSNHFVSSPATSNPLTDLVNSARVFLYLDVSNCKQIHHRVNLHELQNSGATLHTNNCNITISQSILANVNLLKSKTNVCINLNNFVVKM